MFFARPVLRMLIQQPLVAANRAGQYDVICTVSGGGLSGQAGAVRHGISKALTYYEPDLRGVLKRGGFLTRDSPRGRAQEVRPRQGPPLVPVLQALIHQAPIQQALVQRVPPLQFQGRFGAPFILHERVAIEPLLARGDAALYCAKNNGRNRVEFDQADASPAAVPAAIPALGQAVAALR